MYQHMQEILDLDARLGDTSTKEIVILDALGYDTSTNIFEFSPPLSTSNKPN